MQLRFYVVIALALGTALARDSAATVLDWNSVTWDPGSLNNTFPVDGTDVTIDVTNPNGRLRPDPATGTLTPTNNTSLTGGGDPTQKSLLFAVDFAKNDEFLTITISFTGNFPLGVEGLSFTLFDIDKDTLTGFEEYEDQIRSISASDGTNTFAPVITGLGSSVTLTGTGLGQTLTGNAESPDTGVGSGAGNATISFGSNRVTSVTFVYGSGPDTRSNPSIQFVSMSDISFTPVPEVNPAFATVGACAAASLFVLRRRRRRET